MRLHLDGSNSIQSSRERVYALLTDPRFISKTLPDAEDVHMLDGSSIEARIKLRIAVVSTSLKMKMTVIRTNPPSQATLVAEGAGGGSNLKITSVFDLAGDSPTTMTWSADAEIEGVMAGLGSTLLKGFAARKVGEIFSGISRAAADASARQGEER